MKGHLLHNIYNNDNKNESKSKLRLNLVSPSTFATNLVGENKVSNPVYHQCMFLISPWVHPLNNGITATFHLESASFCTESFMLNKV
jgi:hypothetical protein